MKKFKKILLILILVIIISTITFFIGKQIGLNTNTSTTTTTVTEETVSKHTITTTLSSTGEIETAKTEELGLDTSKYFSTMCVEEDDTVSEGENILEYTNGTYLIAPYDCVIESYSVPESQSKCTSSNNITIKSLKELQTSLNINESEISQVSEGQKVEITLSADESITYEGTISNLDSVGQYSTSGATFGATVQFENDGNAKIGMSISATIILQEVSDVVAVPIDAVTTENDKYYVEVVNEETGETNKTEVETGVSDEEYVEIISGLEEGDKIQITRTTTQSNIREDSEEESSGNMGQQRGGRMEQGGEASMMQGGSEQRGTPPDNSNFGNAGNSGGLSQ